MKTVNPLALACHVSAQPGEVLNESHLTRGLLRAYGDGWYETVDYFLLTLRDRRIFLCCRWRNLGAQTICVWV